MKLDDEYSMSLMEEFYITCAYTTGIRTIILAFYCTLQCYLDFTSKTYCIVLVKPTKQKKLP